MTIVKRHGFAPSLPQGYARRMIAGFRQKWATATAQKPLFYLWLAPAWLLLGISRLIVLTIPFRYYAKGLGTLKGAASPVPLSTSAQQSCARVIQTTIRVAAKYAPWNANCFAQALTARIILGVYNIPYAFFFGLRNDTDESGDKDLKAHAWVISGPVTVTGGSRLKAYTSVACYVSRP